MAEPSDDDVAIFSSVTGASTQLATLFLRRYHTVEQATNGYFDNNGALPDEPPQFWENQPFQDNNPQPYGPENRPTNAFNIQSADDHAIKLGTAYSRPPSRVSNYAAHQDLSEDQQIEQAINMSMSQTLPGQESGVIGASGGQFRPATQEYYDTQNWAMTVPNFQTREYLQNPEAENRRRQEGAPAFMKPLSAASFLPALITILHAIPMAKEALLARDIVLSDYGTSSDWWDGTPIHAPRIVYMDESASSSEGQDIIFECQRLMAFLEQTQRAYGSVESLLQLDDLRHGITDVTGDFLNIWQNAVQRALPEFDLGNIFTSSAINDPTAVAAGEDESASLTEFRFPITNQSLMLGSLYDALDEMIWPLAASEDEIPSVYLEFGEILIMRPSNGNSTKGLGIDIPAVFHPDRYLKSSAELSKQLQAGRLSLFTKLREGEDTKNQLTTIQIPTSDTKELDANTVLDIAISYLTESPNTSSTVRNETNSDALIEIEQEEETFQYSTAAEELQSVVARVAEKVKTLEDSRDGALRQLRELSDQFKQPQVLPDGTAHEKYTLRGVCTDHTSTYVLANPNTVEDLIDTEVADWQWWKITYAPNNENPVSWQRVLEADVLKAAKSEASSVLLVYASDKAVHYPTSPLPSRLRNFVRADNLAFSHELDAASRRRSGSTKRKATTSSNADHFEEPILDLGESLGVEDEAAVAAALDPPPYEPSLAASSPLDPLVDYDVNMHFPEQYLETSQPTVTAEDEANFHGDSEAASTRELTRIRSPYKRKSSSSDLQERGIFGAFPKGTGLGAGEDANGGYIAGTQIGDLRGRAESP